MGKASVSSEIMEKNSHSPVTQAVTDAAGAAAAADAAEAWSMADRMGLRRGDPESCGS